MDTAMNYLTGETQAQKDFIAWCRTGDPSDEQVNKILENKRAYPWNTHKYYCGSSGDKPQFKQKTKERLLSLKVKLDSVNLSKTSNTYKHAENEFKIIFARRIMKVMTEQDLIIRLRFGNSMRFQEWDLVENKAGSSKGRAFVMAFLLRVYELFNVAFDQSDLTIN